MNRKSKLFFSLVSLCFSIAVLCFGVYSAMQVSYTVSGSVSYEIKDVFVELDLSVYRALSTTPVNSATHNQNVSTIKDAGDNISKTDFGKLSYTSHESTYEDKEVKPGNEDGIFEADSPNLALTYGSPTNDNQGYAFYIVIDIHNLGSEIINAQIKAPTSLENTILRDSGNVEITADGTERIVLGLALDDVTTGITNADFTYTITISRGELPAEPITDMEFAFNEENKTATLTSYIGSGGDVTIPESIGYASPSSMTLTFNTMEDMTSDDMNMMYFYQDLNITLPNQEAELIPNPMLWLYENMDMETGSLPQDYFPMTIQTVESYTIDQEDYNKYATLDQSVAMMVTIMPISMIIKGLCNSVDVQYVTEGQSFTFNMENYNAAMAGDNSPTSLAIQDFMSKIQSDPKSLLPVTYSNFKYSKVFEGDEYSVTSIGEDAFRDCSNLTSIEIPSSVTCIGSYAFSDTPWLTNLQKTSYGIATASDGQTKFVIDVPTNITDDKLDMTNVKVIADYAFQSCSNLTSIEIPSSVTNIGGYAFDNCYKLENITVDPSNANYCSDEYGVLFNKNKTELIQYPIGNTRTQYTIPSGVTNIGGWAFSDCDALTSIEIPSSVISIGEEVFGNCLALETVTFGENSQLASIGSSAFQYCSNLTSIEIPSSVTSIGGNAFFNCDALKTVTFGEKSQLASIGNSAFQYCSNLTSIEIPSSVTSIGNGAFSGCNKLENITVDPSNANYCSDEYGVLFNKDKTALIQYPVGNTRTQYTIPSGVTSIGGNAFFNCDALKTVTFGDNSQLASIGDEAFYRCSALTSIEIPSSVTSIGNEAFQYCDALQTVTFGENSQLGSIGNSAFSYCTNLTSIKIPSSVTSIDSYAFQYCDALQTVTFEDAGSVWVLDNISNTEIKISEHTPQVLAGYLTSNYSYCNYTWTKKQSV